MNTTANTIMKYAASLPEGATMSAKELLHLGERAAVDQALSRLVRRGQLLRVGRGVYTSPVSTRFGERAPAPEMIVKSIAERTGEIITASGATAANRLGLTTQNPVKTVYLTSGSTRQLKIGNQIVELRHSPAWKLRGPGSRAGEAMRALAWFGPSEVKGKSAVVGKRLTKAERKELMGFRAKTPNWLAQELSGLAVSG